MLKQMTELKFKLYHFKFVRGMLINLLCHKFLNMKKHNDIGIISLSHGTCKG